MTPPLPDSFLTIPLAHRGYHDADAGRPENTRAAVTAAIAAGYGIEVDIQPSRDGVAMVFHDAALGRLTGRAGDVTDLTAAELGALSVLDSDQTVPTLAEVLQLVAGQVPLLIEIKDQHGELGPVDGALERAVAQDLAGYDGPAAVMSFNPASVAAMAELAPQTPRGLVTGAFEGLLSAGIPDPHRLRLRRIADFDAVGASFISHDRADLDRAEVGALRDRGVPVLCWTVRDPDQEAAARQVAHNITFEGYPAPLSAA